MSIADPILAALVARANQDESYSPGITLLVGGALISGMLIGSQRFLAAMGIDSLKDAPGAWANDCICLEKAKCFALGRDDEKYDHPVVSAWRCKLADVSGFSLGLSNALAISGA